MLKVINKEKNLKIFFNTLGRPTKVIALIIILVSLLAIPKTFSDNYGRASGHYYYELVQTEMPDGQARNLSHKFGLKSAIYLIFGEHLPFTIFALIAVGLFSKTVVFKRKLIFLYFLIVVAIIFFAIGGKYRMSNDSTFSSSFFSAMSVYVGFSIFFWLIVGSAIAIQRVFSIAISKKQKNGDQKGDIC